MRPTWCAGTATSLGMMNTGVAMGMLAAGARSGLGATAVGVGCIGNPMGSQTSSGDGEREEFRRSFSFWRSR